MRREIPILLSAAAVAYSALPKNAADASHSHIGSSEAQANAALRITTKTGISLSPTVPSPNNSSELPTIYPFTEGLKVVGDNKGKANYGVVVDGNNGPFQDPTFAVEVVDKGKGKEDVVTPWKNNPQSAVIRHGEWHRDPARKNSYELTVNDSGHQETIMEFTVKPHKGSATMKDIRAEFHTPQGDTITGVSKANVNNPKKTMMLFFDRKLGKFTSLHTVQEKPTATVGPTTAATPDVSPTPVDSPTAGPTPTIPSINGNEQCYLGPEKTEKGNQQTLENEKQWLNISVDGKFKGQFTIHDGLAPLGYLGNQHFDPTQTSFFSAQLMPLGSIDQDGIIYEKFGAVANNCQTVSITVKSVFPPQNDLGYFIGLMPSERVESIANMTTREVSSDEFKKDINELAKNRTPVHVHFAQSDATLLNTHPDNPVVQEFSEVYKPQYDTAASLGSFLYRMTYTNTPAVELLEEYPNLKPYVKISANQAQSPMDSSKAPIVAEVDTHR